MCGTSITRQVEVDTNAVFTPSENAKNKKTCKVLYHWSRCQRSAGLQSDNPLSAEHHFSPTRQYMAAECHSHTTVTLAPEEHHPMCPMPRNHATSSSTCRASLQSLMFLQSDTTILMESTASWLISQSLVGLQSVI